MERNPSVEGRSLEQKAAELLRRTDPITVAEVDRLLTEGAAQALRLRTEGLRAERDLHQALGAAEGEVNGVPTPRTLSARSRRLAAERERNRATMEALRAERDRLAHAELRIS